MKKEYDKETTIVIDGEIVIVLYKEWDEADGTAMMSVEVPKLKTFTIVKKMTVEKLQEYLTKLISGHKEYEREVVNEILCRRVGVDEDGVLNRGRTWFCDDKEHYDERFDTKRYEIWGVGLSDDGDTYLRHGINEKFVMTWKNNCLRAFDKE